MCKTERGDPCVFPFWYDRIKHFRCTQAQAGISIITKPWCATTITFENHTYSDSDWGNCQEGCPTEGEIVIKIITSLSAGASNREKKHLYRTIDFGDNLLHFVSK